MVQEGEKRKVHDLAKENREEDFMDIEVRTQSVLLTSILMLKCLQTLLEKQFQRMWVRNTDCSKYSLPKYVCVWQIFSVAEK